jgi:hypothetical protein
MGSMMTFLYSEAFVLTAGLDYISDSTANTDIGSINVNRHITNLSVNKRCHGHPGQIPYNIAKENPKVMTQLDKFLEEIVSYRG